jgi:prepilin-type N-terminal cleavage/methylation domain-containing protein
MKKKSVRPTRNPNGFSMLELVLVIALIGLISTLTIPTLSNYFSISINSVARGIATSTRQGYNAAVVTGRVHRMVYDLDNNQYWVESGPPGHLLDTEDSIQKELDKRRGVNSDAPKQKPSEFKIEPNVNLKKSSLPRGTKFKDIITEQAKEPITKGKAYTHFFPQGFSEQTIIHIEDGQKHQISLVVTTLLGKSQLFQKYVDKKEVFGEKR